MVKDDQLHRAKWQARMNAMPDSQRIRPDSALTAMMQEQAAIDRRNGLRLDEIIAQHGWPGRSLVGGPASQAAYLVLAHADSIRQHRYLPLLKAAAAKGEAVPADAATLEDQVLVREGRKQIYGTRVHFGPETNGRWELYPIEDEEHVDERRAAVGLPPLAEYKKLMEQMFPRKRVPKN